MAAVTVWAGIRILGAPGGFATISGCKQMELFSAGSRKGGFLSPGSRKEAAPAIMGFLHVRARAVSLRKRERAPMADWL